LTWGVYPDRRRIPDLGLVHFLRQKVVWAERSTGSSKKNYYDDDTVVLTPVSTIAINTRFICDDNESPQQNQLKQMNGEAGSQPDTPTEITITNKKAGAR
jgi:hypothetical protein